MVVVDGHDDEVGASSTHSEKPLGAASSASRLLLIHVDGLQLGLQLRRNGRCGGFVRLPADHSLEAATQLPLQPLEAVLVLVRLHQGQLEGQREREKGEISFIFNTLFNSSRP